MAFQKVAKVEDLWSGEMIGLEVNGEHILLVNVDNRIYAYADACPHQRSRLSEGTLTAKVLRCAGITGNSTFAADRRKPSEYLPEGVSDQARWRRHPC